MSVPGPVQRKLKVPARVQLTHPVPLAHHRVELQGRLHGRPAVRLDLHVEPGRPGEQAMVRIAWVRAGRDALTLAQARLGGLVRGGAQRQPPPRRPARPGRQPVGAPVLIPLLLAGLPASTRDARLRRAITELLTVALSTGARAIAIEDLGFHAEGSRDKHGRNKKFRTLLSGFPTAAFRERLVAMATTAGLTVIAVDPRSRQQGRRAGRGAGPARRLPGRQARARRPHHDRDAALRCCCRDRPARSHAQPQGQTPTRSAHEPRSGGSAGPVRDPPEKPERTQPRCVAPGPTGWKHPWCQR